MRLIYSILREINQSNTPKATDYKMKDYEFRKIIHYIKGHNYIKGEVITFTDILLGGAKVNFVIVSFSSNVNYRNHKKGIGKLNSQNYQHHFYLLDNHAEPYK
ncbi:hypothetical protein V1503_20640 [Bacillus sp. SCS-151]|uniref:hypothetical protein n=1 Tax=Nanhaiella sioensis TaxID=3115293 RepID=UPI0039781459